MKLTRGAKSNLQTMGIIFLIVSILFVLYKIQELLVYIFIALVISLLCRPLMLLLKRLGFNGNLSALVTLVFVMGVISLLAWVFFPIIVEQGKNISEIDFERVKTDLNELNIQASEYLGLKQINIVEAIKESEAVKNMNAELLKEVIATFINNIGTMAVGVFSVLFISFFLLRDDSIAVKAVTVFADRDKERRFLVVLGKSKILLSRYFLGLLIQITVITLLYLGLLMYLGVQNPLAVALICAFLNVVPYLGPLIGGAVILLVVLSNNLAADFSSGLLPLLVIAGIGIVIVQLFDNIVSQPLIFSHSVKSHPLEIFIVIIMGGLLMGILGMILAVPVYTTIKVISKEFLSEYKIVKQLTRDM